MFLMIATQIAMVFSLLNESVLLISFNFDFVIHHDKAVKFDRMDLFDKYMQNIVFT